MKASPKLINEIRTDALRGSVRNALEYVWALVGPLLLTLEKAFPSIKARKAITPLITVAIIVIIVAAGVLVIYLLVISPSSSTTPTYPPP